MSQSVIQIVPRLPPAVCGIGDYATELARALRAEHGIETRFVVAGIEGRDVSACEFPAARVRAGDIQALRAAVADQAGAVILHVSTYGYQKRGAPLWLARSLEDLPGAPVVAMFHELYAGGPPSTSAFWVQPLQKIILRMLVRSAARLRTNRSGYAQWLNAVSGRPATVMPVFSNLGELAQPPALAERPEAMVMFASGIHGGGDARGTVLRGVTLCRKLGLNTLHVLGIDAATESTEGVAVHYQKFLPADDATQLLARCRAAFTTYAPRFFAKSGVFAAYAAHGLAVVVTGDEVELPDGLWEGKEVIREQTVLAGEPRASELQTIANGLHQWYGGHSIRQTAASFAADIRAVAKVGVA